jgi:hypothetical protein
VKHSRILVTVLSLAVLVAMSGCGSSDKVESVSMSVQGASGGTVDLYGLGGTLQLQVMTNYSSGKVVNETNYATFTVTIPTATQPNYYCLWDSNGDCTQEAMPTPPQGITISPNGLITAVDPGVCSWINVGTSSQPAWAYSGYYQINATNHGFTSNPVFIPLASAASGQPIAQGLCGPQPTN